VEDSAAELAKFHRAGYVLLYAIHGESSL